MARIFFSSAENNGQSVRGTVSFNGRGFRQRGLRPRGNTPAGVTCRGRPGFGGYLVSWFAKESTCWHTSVWFWHHEQPVNLSTRMHG